MKTVTFDKYILHNFKICDAGEAYQASFAHFVCMYKG